MYFSLRYCLAPKTLSTVAVFFVCSSSRNMPGYLSLVVFRVASMQRWGTPTARRPWTLFTSSQQHRPAGRSSSSWGVGSLQVEAAVIRYYYCYYNYYYYYYMDTFCRLIERLLSSARCFSSSAGSRPERLLQQLRPDQPQYQSGRRHYGKNAAEKKKKRHHGEKRFHSGSDKPLALILEVEIDAFDKEMWRVELNDSCSCRSKRACASRVNISDGARAKLALSEWVASFRMSFETLSITGWKRAPNFFVSAEGLK